MICRVGTASPGGFEAVWKIGSVKMFEQTKRMSKKLFGVNIFFSDGSRWKRVKLCAYIGGKWNFVQASIISPAKIFQKVVDILENAAWVIIESTPSSHQKQKST